MFKFLPHPRDAWVNFLPCSKRPNSSLIVLKSDRTPYFLNIFIVFNKIGYFFLKILLFSLPNPYFSSPILPRANIFPHPKGGHSGSRGDIGLISKIHKNPLNVPISSIIWWVVRKKLIFALKIWGKPSNHRWNEPWSTKIYLFSFLTFSHFELKYHPFF